MKWNNWIRKKTDKHLLRGAGKWRRKKYKNLLFFPLSEGVASPFNQVFSIYCHLMVFPLWQEENVDSPSVEIQSKNKHQH